MLPAGLTVRRATLDDLEMLRGVWREARLPEFELERRFTEFQIVLDSNGWILAALGLRFSGHHGQVHSLAIRRTDLEADLRSALLDRIVTLGHQHGALRLWTRESGDFWSDKGFLPPTPEERRDLPPAFGGPAEAWRTLKLRDEPLKLIAAEEQLEAYLEVERLKTERLVRRGQLLKLIATAIAVVVFAFALAALVILVRRGRRPPPPP